MVPQPRREPFKAVLFVRSSGDDVASVGACDDEGKDEDDEEDGDEEGHEEEVDSEESLLVSVGADESGEGYEEDERAKDDDGPTEVVGTLAVGLGGQPYSGGDDRDGA